MTKYRPFHVFCLTLALLVCVGPALADALQNETSAPLSAAHLSKINAALKNLPPQSGRFEQILPNGGTAKGQYHMHWPERLRFSYGPQSADAGGSVVTVRGKFVAVQETPRAEPNWFPVALTPLAVLRRAIADGISPSMIVAHQDTPRFVSLTLHDPEGTLPGTATLYFAQPDLHLYAWRLVDVQNLVTQVRLFAEDFPPSLSERLFDIDYDDELEDD